MKNNFSVEDDVIHGDDKPSELAKVTEILLNSQFRRRKTNLNIRLISAITTLDTLSQIYDIEFLQEWIPSYCEYLTSVDGGGRKDIVDITTAKMMQEKERHDELISLVRGSKP